MPIIDGGHVEFLYNHWAEKMETVLLLIYGLYIRWKKHLFKINMNMTQNYTLTYTKTYLLGISDMYILSCINV